MTLATYGGFESISAISATSSVDFHLHMCVLGDVQMASWLGPRLVTPHHLGMVSSVHSEGSLMLHSVLMGSNCLKMVAPSLVC